MTQNTIGESVPRFEDRALLEGSGRFIDDLRLPELLGAAFVRSPFAHAIIQSRDATAARAMPGVHAVYFADDIADLVARDVLSVGLPSNAYKQEVDRPILARDEVCYVGEAVAVVIADDRYIAEDAATLVEIDYDPLPAVADCKAANLPDAPTVHRDAPDNVVAAFTVSYGDCDAAFDAAPHVFPLSLFQHRGLSLPIECRGAMAQYDTAFDRWTLWSSTQMPHALMRMLVNVFGCGEQQMRVITPDVGGGFGPKLVVYPEEIVLCAAAKALRRPVKWIEDRREHIVSTTQERDQYWDMEVAVENDGRLIGVRGTVIHDHGAYTARGINIVQNAVNVVPGPYMLPNFEVEANLVMTNAVPVTPVRGAGHPQGIFAMERLLDLAARELGIDRIEIRRRNLIPAEAMPYATPLKNRAGRHIIYDSGDYPGCLDKALAAADHDGFAARQAVSERRGLKRGFGVANYVKGTGRGPYETAIVRIGPSGRISVYTGAVAIGQGTATMLAQVAADELGGDPANVSVVMGDTAALPMGFGTSASRVAVIVGSSTHRAAREVRRKVLKHASRMLEASEEDLEIVGARVRVRGVPELGVDLADIAVASMGASGAAVAEDEAPGLEATDNFIANDLTYANGTHAVEVEVDPETGAVDILRYVVVGDCGRMINPALVDGQVRGGATHGTGNALFERFILDESGQPQTTNLAEYLIPTAPEMPPIEVLHLESPTPHNPLGVKGVGESGVVPAAAAILSAVEDALSPFGVHITEAPLGPMRIVEMVNAGKAAG